MNIKLPKSTLIVKNFNVEGYGSVQDNVLKIRYPGQSLTEYKPEDMQNLNIEVLDAMRKDITALRKAGFVLVLKKEEKKW